MYKNGFGIKNQLWLMCYEIELNQTNHIIINIIEETVWKLFVADWNTKYEKCAIWLLKTNTQI